jgi:hypothetical protein
MKNSSSGQEGAVLKKPHKKKYKSPLKRRKERCDELFSQYIKSRDKTCQSPSCKHESTTMDWSHFIGRARTATRWDEDNGYTLCRKCHQYFDGNELGRLEYDAIVARKLGQDRYFALKEKARQITKERDAVEECENFLRSKGVM